MRLENHKHTQNDGGKPLKQQNRNQTGLRFGLNFWSFPTNIFTTKYEESEIGDQ